MFALEEKLEHITGIFLFAHYEDIDILDASVSTWERSQKEKIASEAVRRYVKRTGRIVCVKNEFSGNVRFNGWHEAYINGEIVATCRRYIDSESDDNVVYGLKYRIIGDVIKES